MVVPVVMLILLIVFWLILVYLNLSTTSQIVYITNDLVLGPAEQSKHIGFQMVFQNLCLALQCIILKNNQRHFQNLMMFPPQDFKNKFDYFSASCMKENINIIGVLSFNELQLLFFWYCMTLLQTVDKILPFTLTRYFLRLNYTTYLMQNLF